MPFWQRAVIRYDGNVLKMLPGKRYNLWAAVKMDYGKKSASQIFRGLRALKWLQEGEQAQEPFERK